MFSLCHNFASYSGPFCYFVLKLPGFFPITCKEAFTSIDMQSVNIFTLSCIFTQNMLRQVILTFLRRYDFVTLSKYLCSLITLRELIFVNFGKFREYIFLET